MFSGVIRAQGKIIAKRKSRGILRLVIKLNKQNHSRGGVTPPLQVGDSIAVSGVCLTATQVNRRGFEADVIDKTLKATTLGQLAVGDRVNLERSLKAQDRVDGHFVTGHVDGCGRIEKIETRGRNRVLSIRAPRAILSQLVPKGSVAVDGISLTIQSIRGAVFTVALVPHTFRETSLKGKKKGDLVNLEIDLIMRYLNLIFTPRECKILHSRGVKRFHPKKLKRQGF